jgi:phenylpropionate dioxygenase-like ring-hydroxylating dioxygenase large terminal subunit
VVLAEELPKPDSDPIRLKVLGEDLVAFRDSYGNVGLIDNNCPHRRASMFFGRNEECGLRCVYHGWKFDINGDCVDMPSEPAESNFKDKVKITAYPTREFGSVIWAYMGPADKMPELPQFEWATVPDSHRLVTRWTQDSNYMQAVEGEIDSAHINYLHSTFEKGQRATESQFGGSNKGAPELTMKETDYGFIYGARRDAGKNGDSSWWRATQWLLPAFSLIAGSGWPRGGHMYFPQDNEHISAWEYSYNPEAPLTEQQRIDGRAKFRIFPTTHQLPDGSITDTFRMEANPENDFLMDRQAQREWSFTGIKGIRHQDMAMVQSMGRISNREGEHLGTSDKAIITARRRLIQMAKDLQEGIEPYAATHGDLYKVRSIDFTAPEHDFTEFLEAHHELAEANN